MAKSPRPIYAISAAEEISAGYSELEVIAILRKRFGALSDEHVDVIMGQARAMVNAGMAAEANLSQLSVKGETPSEPIPDNADEVAISVSITPEGGETKFRELRVPFPKNSEWQDILDEIEAAIEEWRANSGEDDDEIVWDVKYLIFS